MNQSNINPLVSVIIATYNRAYILSNAIDSVLSQSYKNIEIIIIDDGSTDNTFQIVNNYFLKNSNIKYLKQSNQKLWAARNIGLRISEGKYVTFLDSDDEYKRDHISLRVDYMNKNPSVDLIYGGLEINGDPYVPDKFDKNKMIHIDNCIVGGTFFGKREIFLKLDGFKNITYSEDSEFFERASKTFKVEKVEFKTYIYNRNLNDTITKLS